jgi:acyl carrier protein
MNGGLVRPVIDVLTESSLRTTALERWLIAHIASLANRDQDDIEVTQPFSHYALDSVATVGLTADLEDLLGLELPPTLIWDYPTIASLARHLATLEAPAS